MGDENPSRKKHKRPGDIAPSDGQFFQFFHENNTVLGIFEIKFLLVKHTLTITEKDK